LGSILSHTICIRLYGGIDMIDPIHDSWITEGFIQF
jgi:hypothetical protein